MKTASGTSVMGWGYEGKTPADLISDSLSWGIKTVVDVRLTPLSRKAGFSKRGLAAHLEANGIDYVHLPALGNPRDNRAGFADTTGLAGRDARERFGVEVLEDPSAIDALDTLIELADHGSVLLLCFEANEGTCHRRMVLDALRERYRALVRA